MSLFNRFALWPLLFFGHFLATSLLAWHLLAQVDFGYAWGYQALSIDQHIQVMGPENYYKQDFERTDGEEHRRLFGAINDSVHNRGEGLADIHYPLPDGEEEPLLREPEIIHLEDVSRLITHFYWAGGVAAVLLAGLIGHCAHRRLAPPPVKKVVTVMTGLLVMGGLLLWLIGPVRVFYWLHDYAFPSDNPWFFYYQESLMTTLMKAPDLFGFIGALLLALTLLIWSLSGWPLWRWLKSKGQTPAPNEPPKPLASTKKRRKRPSKKHRKR